LEEEERAQKLKELAAKIDKEYADLQRKKIK